MPYPTGLCKHAFNPIEPKWAHGKKAIVEPERLLAANEVRTRVCDYYGGRAPGAPRTTIRLKLHYRGADRDGRLDVNTAAAVAKQPEITAAEHRKIATAADPKAAADAALKRSSGESPKPNRSGTARSPHKTPPCLRPSKTFDAGDIRQAATDMIEGLQLHIDRGLSRPEDLWYKLDRTAQVMKLAWMLESPGMAQRIAQNAPKGDQS